MATSKKPPTVYRPVYKGIVPKRANGPGNAPRSAKNAISRPTDWIRGSLKKGGKYTAWDTFGQGKPDMGKGKGPGDPYHEVTRTNGKPIAIKPRIPRNQTRYNPTGDARMDAIQRRLRGL